ncbi:hypothetical protein AVEN_96256-1 [Araneus ventricosus]|uniref:Uncharacterized protein n=1 Tax=Araneus ventricosus TaxID=182803 RepID=A0A4Y2WKH6_ARAVE|nr:hypothetical protein AVEN_96256-1 [Araneus ventricosus]
MKDPYDIENDSGSDGIAHHGAQQGMAVTGSGFSSLGTYLGASRLEEGGGLVTAGESSKSSDILYSNVSPSDASRHQHQIPEIVKPFSLLMGEKT